ncbi:acyl-CoA thioesterase [Paenibacillus albus]|nr:thioesterase family protein [Paenibacillus albus]
MKEEIATEAKALWHMHPLRVRYQETDQMGVVFHGNYLTWFEIGRTELVRSLGLSYIEIEKAGLLLPVVDANISYVSPARYDDIVFICTRIEELSPIRMAFCSEIRMAEEQVALPQSQWWHEAEPPGKLLTRGGTRHVWVNRDWRPARLDKAFPAVYGRLQAAAAGVVQEEGSE